MDRKEFSPDNNSESEVDKSKIVIGFFLKTDQQFAETVEEGMGDLNDPATGMKTRISLQFLFLIASGPDMSNVSPGFHLVLMTRVASVKAKVLRSFVTGFRA